MSSLLDILDLLKVEYCEEIFKICEERDVFGLTTAHGARNRIDYSWWTYGLNPFQPV